MFLGLPDPDPKPSVGNTDRDPAPIHILPFSHKGVETEILLAI
jgi:hypothetical protein